MDNLDDLKAAAAAAMQRHDLIWDQQPYWSTAPFTDVPNNRVGTIQIIAGRLLSTKSGRTEFIGPHSDEVRFWTEAKYVAQDTPWDEPHQLAPAIDP